MSKLSALNLLLVLCSFAGSTRAQQSPTTLLTVGNTAPTLRVKEWLKGSPVKELEKGRVYVIEFWATWCGPCVAAMPHLSKLARQYEDQVTIIGIDVKERQGRRSQTPKAFVDSMEDRMDYRVASEDTAHTVADWLDASNEQGIPVSYVVDRGGELAWIGSPFHLEEVLAQVVDSSWDMSASIAKRKEQKRLERLEREAMDRLNYYRRTGGKEDSLLIVINEIVQQEPKLKYSYIVASATFSSLLGVDPNKAYAFGKEVLANPSYDGDPAYLAIFGVVDSYWYANDFALPKEIFALAAEACQAEIDAFPYAKKSRHFYHKMADWYWRAGDKANAVAAEQIAIERLNSEATPNLKDLTAYQSRLKLYNKM